MWPSRAPARSLVRGDGPLSVVKGPWSRLGHRSDKGGPFFTWGPCTPEFLATAHLPLATWAWRTSIVKYPLQELLTSGRKRWGRRNLPGAYLSCLQDKAPRGPGPQHMPQNNILNEYRFEKWMFWTTCQIPNPGMSSLLGLLISSDYEYSIFIVWTQRG